LEQAQNKDAAYVKLGGIDFDSGLDGNYYPVLLEDTYALKVNYSGKERTPKDKPEPIETLGQLKQEIVSKINHRQDNPEIDPDKRGSLGETWLVWGQLTKDNEQYFKTVANECYTQLAPKGLGKASISEPGKLLTGQLLGGTLFEFWQHPSSSENYHLLVWLFPPGEKIQNIEEQVKNLYFDLIRLFCYRNKVIWAYRESRQIKTELKEKYTLAQESINNLEKEIKDGSYSLNSLREKLTHNLKEISNYTDTLNRLTAQDRTIKVNLDNYTKRLRMIADKDKSSQVKVLSEFKKYATLKYQTQIESDRDNLSYGLTLLQNLIRTIEGIIEIEQTKSDRQLENLIAAASVGVGTASAAASAASALVKDLTPFYPFKVDKNQLPLAEPLSNLAFILLFSLGLGWIFGWLTSIYLRRRSEIKASRP
ncbi:MAG TPA: hypothetical protein V6D12_08755, partial [Candidatus Obscuribacterales bacterium]